MNYERRAEDASIVNEPNVASKMEEEATSRRDSVDDVSKSETAASGTRVMSDTDADNTPIRKLQRKPHVNRQRRHPVTTPASESDRSENKCERNVDDDFDDDDDAEGGSRGSSRDAIEAESTKGPSTERIFLTKEKVSSALESEKSKLDRVPTKEGAKEDAQRAGEPSADGGFGTQRRRAKDSLRSFFERKIDLMERIMEDRVERFSGKFWEENTERHSWLQPIDTWIAEHRKPTSSYPIATHCQRYDDRQDVASRPAYNCETIDEEPEERTTEHPRGEEAGGSSRSTNQLDLANLIAQSKKQKIVPTLRVEYREDDVSIDVSPNESAGGIGEAKEAKRHNSDLLDKLKDNVKEKMEDIHRVVGPLFFHRVYHS